MSKGSELSGLNSTAVDRIIVALDVPSFDAGLRLVDQLPAVQWWKVGLQIFTAAGSRILNELQRRHKRIFLDLKLHDIPNTVAGAAKAAADQGVDLLTLHAMGGSDMIRAAVEAVQGSSCKLLAVTVLTSLSSEQVIHELHVDQPLDTYALHLAIMAQQQGVDGAVCSPREVNLLRQACGSAFLLVTPGIRPANSRDPIASDPVDRADRDPSAPNPRYDQKRILTPEAALASGAHYLVIGRPITAAPDPAQAFATLCSSLSPLAEVSIP